MAATAITPAHFNADLTLKKPHSSMNSIILIHQEGCPPCMAFKPQFEAAAASNTNPNVEYLSYNLTKNGGDIFKNGPFQVDGVPLVVFYSNRVFKEKYEGDRDVRGLQAYAKAQDPPIKELESQDFNADLTLKAPFDSVPLTIMCYSNHCGHCKNFKPIFKSAGLRDPSAFYAMVNIDEEPKVGRATKPFKINGVPTVVSYNKGKFYSMFGGKRTEQDLKKYSKGIGSAPITYVNKK